MEMNQAHCQDSAASKTSQFMATLNQLQLLNSKLFVENTAM